MSRNFQNVCVTVFLSIVILFITGVAFPKYVSSWNLKHLAILNSSVANLKLISKDYLVSNQTDAGIFTNSSSFGSSDEENDSSPQSTYLQSITFNQLQTPVKRSRFKRNTITRDNFREVFSWNFKLNISRSENIALNKVTKNDSKTSDGKHLEIAVNAESRGSEKTALSELQKVLDSVGSFLKKTFGNGSENEEYDDKGLNVEIKNSEGEYFKDKLDIYDTQNVDISITEKGENLDTISNQLTRSSQEVSPVPELMVTQNYNTEELPSGNRNESGRRGRIFKNILELGGKLFRKASNDVETEAPVTETETSTLRSENLPHDELNLKSESVTENSNREVNFHSDSLEFPSELPMIDLTSDHNIENLQSQTTQLHECSGCVKGDLEFQIDPKKLKESDNLTLETNVSTETLFTDELLEHFCKRLPTDLDESHLNLLRDLKTKAIMTEDTLTSIEATPEFAQTAKQNSFFSTFDGSGRSEMSDEKNLSFGQMDEVSKFPSIMDCLLYFNKLQNNIFLKPNDVNHPANEAFQNFVNSSEIPDLKELKFSSNFNSSIKTFGEMFKGTETNVEKSTLSLENEKITVEETFLKLGETTESNFDMDNKLKISNTDTDKAEKSSNDRRDGKHLSFFGLGSGSDFQENRSISDILFIRFFGSGARSLENPGGSEEFDESVDLGRSDSFLDIQGFSGDDTVLSVSDSAPAEDFGISSGEDPRFLGVLGFMGSGNGRQLIEEPEHVTELSGKETTEVETWHFMGDVFSSGSGDGESFRVHRGPSNLEEERKPPNVVNPRRRGRLNDDYSIDECDDCGDYSELIKESLERPLTNQTANHFSSTITVDYSVKVSPMSRPKDEETTLKISITNLKNTTIRPPSSTAPSELQPRPCVGARDCNTTLGERCILIDSTSVCECGRTFVRHKLTRKCVEKRHVQTTIKLPAETFDSDLRNPESAKYKIMNEKSVDTMFLLVNDAPDIQRIVSEVNVAKFTSGSLIISFNLVLAMENDETVHVESMEDKFQKALKDENLMKKSSLNIRNATVLSVIGEFDPCMSVDLNYCSHNAYCKRKEGSKGRYTCYCKEHFLDVSSDPRFPGEICIDKCLPGYCGPNGHCEIVENEIHCLCNGMYFGERCEYPGMVILGSLSITAIVSLGVLFAVVFKLRCRKISYGGSPTFRRTEDIGPHAIAAGRVSDAIALTENPRAKASKFAKISTPVQIPPMIKVTHPTFIDESAVSFECDSSFDTTPLSERTESTGD